MSKTIDLGAGFSARYFRWKPDREIPANNEKFQDFPDVPKAGIILTCKHGKEGSVMFDRGRLKELFPGPFWTVISEVPLTLSPSINSGCCHGYIRDGKWVDV